MNKRQEERMKKTVITITVVVCVAIFLFPAVRKADIAKEKTAIKQAALDYFEGWYEANTDRMNKALHKELVKRVFLGDPESEDIQFIHLDKAKMLEATQKGGGKRIPAEKRQIKVKILDIYHNIASVRIESFEYVDYCHLAKTGGEWKIVNVLWSPHLIEREAAQIDPAIYAAYVGEYEISPGLVMSITSSNDRIFAQATNQHKIEIFPESETKFFYREVDAQIEFIKDAEGNITKLIIYQSGQKIPAKKWGI